MGRKVFVIGSGGREHALVWALRNKSVDVDEIYCAPGNAGICEDAICVDISPFDFNALIAFAKEKKIDLTVVGPEAPLVRGIVDAFKAANLVICGPSKDGAMLEGSKVWAKTLMKKYGIPTADSQVFDSPNKAQLFVKERGKFPVVIKADGLAAGKGVIIAHNLHEAWDAIDKIMVKREFGEAGERVVIEDFLEGEEASIIALTDGNYILPMASSQDHKAIFDGDKGPNTGGMGAYSSAPVIDYFMSRRIEKEILSPLLLALQNEGIEYRGVIYAGLMITKDGPKVLEFNVRFGDPETQAILPRFKGDFFDLLYATATSGLNRQVVNWDCRQCVCVVLASQGYPSRYEKGKIITGLDRLRDREDIIVFHAGTCRDSSGRIITCGGRVLGISALGRNLMEARDRAYQAVEEVEFDGKYYRKDIAQKGIKHLMAKES